MRGEKLQVPHGGRSGDRALGEKPSARPSGTARPVGSTAARKLAAKCFGGAGRVAGMAHAIPAP
jgi:hypothetical protein